MRQTLKEKKQIRGVQIYKNIKTKRRIFTALKNSRLAGNNKQQLYHQMQRIYCNKLLISAYKQWKDHARQAKVNKGKNLKAILHWSMSVKR